MPIKFVSGDLFDNAHRAKAFAQVETESITSIHRSIRTPLCCAKS